MFVCIQVYCLEVHTRGMIHLVRPTVLPEPESPFVASVTVILCQAVNTVCNARLPGSQPGKWLRTWSGLRGFPVPLVAFG